MKSIYIFIVFTFSTLSLFAQPKEVQVELNHTFAHYQNAYNNSTEAYKMLTKGYKKSAGLSDARYYIGSARKFSVAASEYCRKAMKGGESTLALTSVENCKKSKAKYEEMKQSFKRASEKFEAAKLELDKAMEESDFSVIGGYMSSAVTDLQGGVQNLNLSIEMMNTGSATMKDCN